MTCIGSKCSAAAMLEELNQLSHIKNVLLLLRACVCVCVCVQCVPIAREESDSSDFVDSAEGRLNCSPDNPFL